MDGVHHSVHGSVVWTHGPNRVILCLVLTLPCCVTAIECCGPVCRHDLGCAELFLVLSGDRNHPIPNQALLQSLNPKHES